MSQEPADDGDFEAELARFWAAMRRSRTVMWIVVLFCALLAIFNAFFEDNPLVRSLIIAGLLFGSALEIHAIIESRLREAASRAAWHYGQQLSEIESANLEAWADHRAACHR